MKLHIKISWLVHEYWVLKPVQSFSESILLLYFDLVEHIHCTAWAAAIEIRVSLESIQGENEYIHPVAESICMNRMILVAWPLLIPSLTGHP